MTEEKTDELILLKNKIEELEKRLDKLEMRIEDIDVLDSDSVMPPEAVSSDDSEENHISIGSTKYFSVEGEKPPETNPLIDAFLKRSDDEIVEEVIQFLKEQKFNFEESYMLNNYVTLYVNKKLGVSYNRYSRNDSDYLLTSKLDAVYALLEIRVRQLEEEEKSKLYKNNLMKAESLVDVCINWCDSNNLQKVAQQDIAMFLSEKEILLDSASTRWFWQKISFVLKTRR
jgi:hypothetical protein